MLFSIREIVVLFSGFLGLLLSIFLLTHNKGNKRSNNLLAAFLILQALALLVTVMLYAQYQSSSKPLALILYYLESALLPIEGFMLYWFCKELLFREAQSLRFLAVHTGGLALLILLASYWYASGNVFDYLRFRHEADSPQVGLAYFFLQLTRFIYALLCLRLLSRYKKCMAQQYSNMNKADFSWLAWLLLAYLLVRGGWLLINLNSVYAVFPYWTISWLRPIVKISYIVLDYGWLGVHLALLFFGLRYSSGFEGLGEIASVKETKTAADYEPLVLRLEEHMQQRRPHTEPDLKLEELATEVSIPAKTLSTIINQRFETNFCGFVNRYRIREASQKLTEEDTKNQSILDIAFAVGFNSKSTFNRAFKQNMGCTPVAYRKQHFT